MLLPACLPACLPVKVVEGILARRQKRFALDHILYRRDQFAEWYGEEKGTRFWDNAPHYRDITELADEWDIAVVRHSTLGVSVVEGRLTTAKLGQLGVLLPGLMMLIGVEHLRGKLESSRLAPLGWQASNIWSDALMIGISQSTSAGGMIYVADFRPQLYMNGDLAKVAKLAMIHYAEEFLTFLDSDSVSEASCVLMCRLNPIMQFLCVEAGKSSG